MKVYTVEAFRFGNRTGGDSKIVGVYNQWTKAVKAAEEYESITNGNYECEVIRFKLGEGMLDPDKLTFPRAVIKGLNLYVYPHN